jgi:hypothetical protein
MVYHPTIGRLNWAVQILDAAQLFPLNTEVVPLVVEKKSHLSFARSQRSVIINVEPERSVIIPPCRRAASLTSGKSTRGQFHDN